MGFVKLVCPNCGASIELSQDREYGFCTYCGTKIMQDKVVVEHRGRVSVSGVADVQALLDRANLFVEDKQFDKAIEYCERVLDIDPKNCNAYIVKLLSQTQCNRIEDLSTHEKPLEKYDSYNKAIRFASQERKDELQAYNKQSVTNYQNILREKEAELDEVNKKLRLYSEKSKNADFWVRNYKLLKGILIIIIAIIVMGMIIGSKTSSPRIVTLIASAFFLVLAINRKANAEKLNDQYNNCRVRAEEVLREYESWVEWVNKKVL